LCRLKIKSALPENWYLQPFVMKKQVHETYEVERPTSGSNPYARDMRLRKSPGLHEIY
jgi:hypothetical protein